MDRAPSAAGVGSDWRRLDGVTTSWFDAPSLVEGAALAQRCLEVAGEIAVDVRATGVRVRLDTPDHAAAVSDAARELGLTADPAALQQLRVVVDVQDQEAVTRFWQRALDYAPGPDGGLEDRWRRDPPLRLRPSTESRPLRNRLHLDVVRPAEAVAQADLGEPTGPYGVRHSDPDGNEVDLVPGEVLGSEPATADWQAVFSAMAGYRTSSPTQQRQLVTVAAGLADDAGFPLLLDLRPGVVIMDSGKDQWEAEAHGLEVDFTALAGRLQTAAHDIGATPDPALHRFVQLFLDAADVASVRGFWSAALGYVADRRTGASDIIDPRRLNPELVFQQLDLTDTARRQQRDRIHVELAVPADQVEARLATMSSAGGRLLDRAAHRWRVADPEGNELVITSEE
jgi:hypothetical protein